MGIKAGARKDGSNLRSIILMEYAVLLLTFGCLLVAALAEIRSFTHCHLING
jgi:hypothetical protein